MGSLLEHFRRSLAEGKEIWLEVHEGNDAARKLYEKQGFVAEGRRPRYYRDGGSAILYTLR
jgi:ribosomal-protein-alanine N-acetyltransferase